MIAGMLGNEKAVIQIIYQALSRRKLIETHAPQASAWVLKAMKAP